MCSCSGAAGRTVVVRHQATDGIQSKSSARDTKKEESNDAPTSEQSENDEEQAVATENMTDEEKAALLTPLQSLSQPLIEVF